MKTTYVLYFYLLCLGCNFKTTKTEQKHDSFKKPDTIIVELPIRPINSETDYMEMEYFIVAKADTSKQSLVLTKNKLNGRLSIDYIYTPYWKSDASYDNDTAAISYKDLPPIVEDKKTYEDQIKEWDVIVEYLSKKYHLDSLRHITTGLTTFKGLSDYIKPTYDTEIEKRLDVKYRGMVNRALLASKPKRDLDKILVKYGLIINDVSTDGIFYFEGYDGKPSLDGKIIFSVKRASE